MDNNNGSHIASEDVDFLNLSLRLCQPSPPPPPSATLLSQPQMIPQVLVHSQQMQSLYHPNPVIQVPSHYPLYFVQPEVVVATSPATSPTMNLNFRKPRSSVRVRGRARRNSSQNNGEDYNRTIQPPYEWATNRPAVVHEMSHLIYDLQIDTITGMVRCNKCDKEYEIRFNLEQKVRQFCRFVLSKSGNMHDRAPKEWSSPPTLTCKYCTSDGVKPIIDENKDNINWLFLFLGQMLGCCTLEQLKFFCCWTTNHRTGAKDRVLFLTYREIYRQLYPNEPQVLW